EIRTSSLIGRNEVANARGAVQLRNPVSEDHVALRTTLLAGLLSTLARNVRAGADRIALFEIGDTFAPETGQQKLQAGLVLSGRLSSARTWRSDRSGRYDFFDLKGIVQLLASCFRNGDVQQQDLLFRRVKEQRFALLAEICLDETCIGMCGQLSRSEAGELDASAPVFFAELRLAEISAAEASAKSFQEIERYPAATRDIAMFVGENITHADVLAAIRSLEEPLLERVELFDLFEDAQATPQGRKSLAYSLTYRNKNRTLTSDEVNAAHTRIRERLRSQVGAQLRE